MQKVRGIDEDQKRGGNVIGSDMWQVGESEEQAGNRIK